MPEIFSSLPVKICGITRPGDAYLALELGAGAIGLNFSDHSPRQVTRAQASSIIQVVRQFSREKPAPAKQPTAFPQRPLIVGVFVEQSVSQANAIAADVGLDWIQLHGQHRLPEVGAAEFPVLWVARVRRQSVNDLAQELSWVGSELVREMASTARQAGPESGRRSDAAIQARVDPLITGVLVDAFVEGEFGGTGHTVAWPPLGQRHQWDSGQHWPPALPLWLAGGLNADNVRQAVAQARPDAIDIASGVETEPGIKCPVKLAAFLGAARAAFAACD